MGARHLHDCDRVIALGDIVDGRQDADCIALPRPRPLAHVKRFTPSPDESVLVNAATPDHCVVVFDAPEIEYRLAPPFRL